MEHLNDWTNKFKESVLYCHRWWERGEGGNGGLGNTPAISKTQLLASYNKAVDTRTRNDNNHTHCELTITACGDLPQGRLSRFFLSVEPETSEIDPNPLKLWTTHLGPLCLQLTRQLAKPLDQCFQFTQEVKTLQFSGSHSAAHAHSRFSPGEQIWVASSPTRPLFLYSSSLRESSLAVSEQ